MADDDIGPALPPGFGAASRQRDSSSDDDYIGPALPPHLAQSKSISLPQAKPAKSDDYGPSLPQHLLNQQIHTSSSKSEPKVIGPSFPPPEGASAVGTADDSSSDDEFVGPSPHLAAAKDAVYDAAAEFAERNRLLKEEEKRKEEAQSSAAAGREEWMMSLPTVGLPQDIGLTARTFRNKSAPQQDESWTLTPEERQKKAAEERKASGSQKRAAVEERHVSERDEEIAKKVSKYNDSNRAQSLMDMHQKKLKKDKKNSKEEKQERVPFSRERDLQVNRFDDAQRKTILKKAALLDTRFSHGSQKYE